MIEKLIFWDEKITTKRKIYVMQRVRASHDKHVNLKYLKMTEHHS